MMIRMGTPISQSSAPLPNPMSMSSVWPATAPAHAQTFVGQKRSVRGLSASEASDDVCPELSSKARSRDRQAYRESFRLPVARDLSTQLVGHRDARQDAAESLLIALRRRDPGSTALGPIDDDRVAL